MERYEAEEPQESRGVLSLNAPLLRCRLAVGSEEFD